MHDGHHAGKKEGAVERQATAIPVVGEEVGVGLSEEADEDQHAHGTHVGILPELRREGGERTRGGNKARVHA